MQIDLFAAIRRRMSQLAAFALLFSLPSLCLGSILNVDYDFSGQPGNQASTSGFSSSLSLAASAVTRGSGLTAVAGANSINSSGWTTAATPDANDYYEFTLTPAIGFAFNVDTIALRERRSNTGILTFTIRSSLDAYATDAIAPIVVPDNAGSRDHNFTLGSTFDNLTTAVTFRIYGYAAEAAGGTWRLEDNATTGAMTITGEISPLLAPVPEASTVIIWTLLSAAAIVAHKARLVLPVSA
jgi:hypothetical protein